MTTKTNTVALRQIPSSIWVLGFISMLMDISSEMIHSLLPLFMVTTLGTSAFAVGLIEGLALLGYALGALTKPVFAMASTTGKLGAEVTFYAGAAFCVVALAGLA